MLLLCPYCQKAKIDLLEPATCPLCGEDLEIFSDIFHAAIEALTMGSEALQQHRYSEAANWAMESYELRKTPHAAALAFVSFLADGDLEQALYWRRCRRRL